MTDQEILDLPEVQQFVDNWSHDRGILHIVFTRQFLEAARALLRAALTQPTEEQTLTLMERNLL